MGEKTRQAYGVDLGQLGAWAAARDLEPGDLGHRDLRRFAAVLGENGAAKTTVARKLAALDQVSVEAADRRQLARDRGLGGAVLAQHAGEAAQLAVAQVERAEVVPGRPLAQLAQVDAVRAARLLPHAAGPLPVVEGGQGPLPTSLSRGGCLLRQHAGRTGRDRRSADRSRPG